MAYIYDLTDTWGNSLTAFNGIKLNVTDTASSAASKLLDLQINGSSKFAVSKSGNVTASGIVQSTSGGFRFPDGTTQTTASVGGAGTVTSVTGAGSVSGLTLTGNVTTSGALTLGGTLSLTSGNVTDALGYTPYNATNPSGYITSSALSPYLTSATAATTYQPLDGDLTAIAALAGTVGLIRKTAANTYSLDTDTYLTGITSSQVTTALGYTPYNATNPSGYLSTVSLTANVTGTLPIANGGTGADNAAGALTSLGAYPAANPSGYTSNTGTVTGVTGTAPIASSGGTAPVISIDAATTSLPGSMSAADKTKLDGIATNANNYVLPKATATTLGGVEVFDATVQTVAANAVSSTAARTYGVQLNAADQMVVNVPWTDTASGGTVTSVDLIAGTGVSVSGGPITSSGSITVTNTAPDQVVSLTAGSNVTVTGSYPNFTIAASGGSSSGGTVTSIDASGGTTGLTFSGGPITTSGTLTLGGTLDLDNGGTGATTASGARTALGLGTAATTDATAYATAAQGAKADTAVQTIASTDGSVTITGTTAIDLSVAVAGSTSNVLLPVRNTTGATLTKGTAVYISGATGQLSTVSKAIASSDPTSAQTLGLITANLANNSNGNVTLIGTITNIDTSAYTDGQQLYLSPTTAGTLTATKPYAPQHLVYMAVVEHAHPSQGKLFVKVQNGYEMDELHDVSAQSPSNNDGLFYNTTTSLWEKKSIVTALGYTPYDSANPTGYITSSALTPYLTSATAATTYQPLDGDLTAIAAISGTTGIVRKTAADTYTLDTNTYLTGITSGQVTTALGYTPYDAANPSAYITSSALSPYLTSATAATTYQPLDGDLTAIAALAGTSGIVRKTAADTYTLDTATYLTGITSGQVTTALGFTPYDASNPAGYTTNTGTVTSVGGTGTVNGITLTGTVTASGSLTLGGTLSGVDLASQITGTLGAANGGTGLTSPGTAGNVLVSNGTAWTSAAPAGGGISYTTKTSAYTAADKDGILANTSAGAFTVTLPASPATGNQVIIADAADTWGSNNLTIARNGATIEGLSENLVCDINGASIQLIYTGTTWQVYAQIGAASGNLLTSASIGTTVQGYDADLQAIGALSGTSGLLQKTAANTWTLNTTAYAPVASPTFSGTVSDGLGKLRAIPQTGAAKTSSYTLTTADVGTFVNVGTGGSVTIPNSTFATGDAISIYNDTTGNITITCSITTAYIGGTNTDKDTMTLATRGVATILFISGTLCVVSGNVS